MPRRSWRLGAQQAIIRARSVKSSAHIFYRQETQLRPTAILALEDGSLFRGVAVGAAGAATGEVIFNTAMTGYQEILTDPAYRRQMIALTYPHIGNAGTNAADAQSDRIQAAGLIVREVPRAPSNWR